MAEDGVYRARTSPGGSTPLSGASPEAFGAGAWGAVADAGRTISRIGDRALARERDAENAAAALDYATISAELDKAEIDGRDGAAPGAAGHTEAMNKLADERRAAALAKIKDPNLRAAWGARYADLKGNVEVRAYSFESAKHTEHWVTQAGDAVQTLSKSAALNPDGMGYANGREAITTLAEGFDGSDEIKQKFLKQGLRTHAVAFGEAMADKDPRAFLGDGKTGGILELIAPDLNAEDVDRLRTRGQAELARLEAKDRQALALEEADYRENMSALGKRIGNADYTVTDQEFEDLVAKANKFGDKSGLLDLASWKDTQVVAVETRDWTPAQWSSAIAELEAKGTKRTAAESLRLKHLTELRPGAESRFSEDPQGWANNAGMPAPAIDWDNPTPAQGQARAQWNRTFMTATGSPPALLGPQELAGFKQRVEQGGLAGKIEVAQQMRGLFGVADGKLALQQIDKGDADLALMVNLPANTAKDYGIGVGALARNSKLEVKDLAAEIFADYGAAVPEGELREAVFKAARHIAAAELDRAGEAEPTDRTYREAIKRGVQRALGATGTKGGLVKWIEAPIWIPPDMEKSDALRRLSRATATSLVEAAAAGSGAPRHMGSDGKLVTFGARAIELLKSGELVSVSPGIFRVRLRDGNLVVDKNRKPWQFDIRKLK